MQLCDSFGSAACAEFLLELANFSAELPEARRHLRAGGRRVLGFALGEPALDVVNKIGCRGPGTKELAYSLSLKCVHVFFRDDSATGYQDVVTPGIANKLRNPRKKRHVRAAQNREADYVGVFLDRRV